MNSGMIWLGSGDMVPEWSTSNFTEFQINDATTDSDEVGWAFYVPDWWDEDISHVGFATGVRVNDIAHSIKISTLASGGGRGTQQAIATGKTNNANDKFWWWELDSAWSGYAHGTPYILSVEYFAGTLGSTPFKQYHGVRYINISKFGSRNKPDGGSWGAFNGPGPFGIRSTSYRYGFGAKSAGTMVASATDDIIGNKITMTETIKIIGLWGAFSNSQTMEVGVFDPTDGSSLQTQTITSTNLNSAELNENRAHYIGGEFTLLKGQTYLIGAKHGATQVEIMSCDFESNDDLVMAPNGGLCLSKNCFAAEWDDSASTLNETNTRRLELGVIPASSGAYPGSGGGGVWWPLPT